MKMLTEICSDPYKITNLLVDYFYVENPGLNKDILWGVCGQYIFENIILNTGNNAMFPFPDIDGDIKYMGKAYSMRKVELCQ